jgi:hypothetical protein
LTFDLTKFDELVDLDDVGRDELRSAFLSMPSSMSSSLS